MDIIRFRATVVSYLLTPHVSDKQCERLIQQIRHHPGERWRAHYAHNTQVRRKTLRSCHERHRAIVDSVRFILCYLRHVSHYRYTDFGIPCLTSTPHAASHYHTAFYIISSLVFIYAYAAMIQIAWLFAAMIILLPAVSLLLLSVPIRLGR